jgi:GNAT superfamily N-acetyltransferase
MNLVVRSPSAADYSTWRHLWDSYLVFYETELGSDTIEELWERILDPESTVSCLVAEADGEPVGLVHFFPHHDTWNARPICYLQDLYVDTSHRGRGIGATLIESVVEKARAQGWSAVYWLTAEDNHQARVLYDRLAGRASGFIHYEIEVG